MEQQRSVPIRCPHCAARLFDTSGTPAQSGGPCVEIRIKCWRCKRIEVLRVACAGKNSMLQSELQHQQPDARNR
jgi:hypothetical protein